LSPDAPPDPPSQPTEPQAAEAPSAQPQVLAADAPDTFDPKTFFREYYRQFSEVPKHKYAIDIKAFRDRYGTSTGHTDDELTAAIKAVRTELRYADDQEEDADDGEPVKTKYITGKRVLLGGAIATATGIISRAVYFVNQGKSAEELRPFITLIIALTAVVLALGVTYFVVSNVPFPKRKKIRYTEVVVIIGLCIIGSGGLWIIIQLMRDAFSSREPKTVYVKDEIPPVVKPTVTPKDVIPFNDAYDYKNDEVLPTSIFGPPNDTDLRAREWMRDLELSSHVALNLKPCETARYVWLLTTEPANTQYTAHVYTGTTDSLVILTFLIDETSSHQGYGASFIPLRKQVSDRDSWYLFDVPKCEIPSKLLVFIAMKHETWRKFKEDNQKFLVRSRAP
jgi:hypothetical protein